MLTALPHAVVPMTSVRIPLWGVPIVLVVVVAGRIYAKFRDGDR